MGQLVAARTQDIGVRMTPGARPRDILSEVLLDGLRQTAAGVAVGVGVWLMALSQTILFSVRPWDPATLRLVCLLLVGVGAAACLAPARRAMRVDPIVAMRP